VPTAFFPQALTFEAANAVILAGLANAAYSEFDEAKAAAAAYGLTAFEWIDLTQQFEDVYGFVAGGPDYVVIAFRGTDPKDWKNWMTDLQATAARFDVCCFFLTTACSCASVWLLRSGSGGQLRNPKP